MTDEEMAEEYLKETFGLYCPTDQERYQVEQAFLAGLKAGRPQWHDLEKDPNDLPKGEKEYIVYSKEWGYEIRKFFVDVGYFECRKNDNIIKWKEIE